MNNRFYLQWHITDACNFRCRHCYQDNFTPNDEMDWACLKAISDNILDALNRWNKQAIITITGGEPFLKKEFFNLLTYLDNQREIEELIIITNGSLITQKTVDSLKKLRKIKRIKLSLEATNQEKNDFIRGKGSFQKTLEAIELLKNDFEVILMFTISKYNLDEVPKLFDFSLSLNTNGFIIERFIPLGQGKQMQEYLLDSRDWQKLVNMVLKFCRYECLEENILPIKAFWITGSPDKWDGKTPQLSGATCAVGPDNLCLMSRGEVYPCRRFNLSLGNLQNQALNEASLFELVRDSKILLQLQNRKNLKGKCGQCLIPDCFGCRALAYSLTGDCFGEDTQCWRKENKTYMSYKSYSSSELVVIKEDTGQRLDVYLTKKLGLSRVRIQSLIKSNAVILNANPVVKPHQMIKCQDRIKVDLPPVEDFTIPAENIPLEVLYEDEDLLVVNKPAGMITHPTHKIKSGTLVNALLSHTKGKLSAIGAPLRPGVVHRLDKDTSGVIVVAKNDRAYWGLARQFNAHTINRVYFALIHGIIKQDKGEINVPIGRAFKGGLEMKAKGRLSKKAITYFNVRERFDSGYSLLEVKLGTGRTHQIRVHLNYIGHQIVGDKRYGKKRASGMKRQALHAHLLGFEHPISNKYLEWTSPMPDDIAQFIKEL
ncbi:MAG: RluA family pseudouridine synthase [Nitrospirota bacterium]